MSVVIKVGHVMDRLREMGDESVDCVVTSPPYYGLRDYGTPAQVWGGDRCCEHRFDVAVRRVGPAGGQGLGGARADRRNVAEQRAKRDAGQFCRCGAWRGHLGLEPTPNLYVEHIVEVFREVRRVLRADGTLWLNLGDSYATGAGAAKSPGGGAQGDAFKDGRGAHRKETSGKQAYRLGDGGFTQPNRMPLPGLKPKDLIGIPWMVAFALRADGWWLRQDVIWCLSGGSWLYARTASKVGPMMLKDLVRLDPSTVELWNGERWTRVTAWTKRKHRRGAMEIVLRSGERIGCTDNHVWPVTDLGNVRTDELRKGDVIKTARLPSGGRSAGWLTPDAFWFAGLYLAEGSRSGATLQISGHVKETARIAKIKDLVEHYGGSARVYNHKGNGQNVHIDSIGLSAVVEALIVGKRASDKRLRPAVWHFRDWELKEIAKGYLEGDGHVDRSRIRLGFCRNYALERDLRTLAARLGATLTLKPATSKCRGRSFPSFRGEWRWERSGHHSEKERGEVMLVRASRARQFWDVTVADHPNLFALSSGVLTHNSKPNPMPESVLDRCTKSHEYLFLLSKSERYYFDAEAIAEPVTQSTVDRVSQDVEGQVGSYEVPGKTNGPIKAAVKRSGNKARKPASERGCPSDGVAGSIPWEGVTRNKRSVWTVNTEPFDGEFCRACRRFWRGDELRALRCERMTRDDGRDENRRWCECGAHDAWLSHFATFPTRLIDDCVKAGCPTGGTVLDLFAGTGTTGLACDRLARDAALIELNEDYAEMARQRIAGDSPMFAAVTKEAAE